MEFLEFPKIARWSREVVVTEKIDGTNAQLLIFRLDSAPQLPPQCYALVGGLGIMAGSRTKWITPDDDNYGFARWMCDNAAELAAGLGEGRHFGEWWGAGIQRKYGAPDKRLSLFNTSRWCAHDAEPRLISSGDMNAEPKYQQRVPACVGVVPELYRGEMREIDILHALGELRTKGSAVAPGFMNPEGIVIFHTAANAGFKKTLVKDEMPKSKAQREAATA